MNDEEFLRRFEDCTLEDFRHVDHVRLAWLCLRASDWPAACARVRDGIRRFAAHHGATTKYHETLTLGWLGLVATAIEASPDATDLDELTSANPRLLDRNALGDHYSAELLWSDRARREWVEPDLRPLRVGAPV